MKSTEKIWRVFYAISEAQKLTPNGAPIELSPFLVIDKAFGIVGGPKDQMPQHEFRAILKILAQDKKVIEWPLGHFENNFLKTLPGFQEAHEQAYFEHTYSLEKMTDMGLVKLTDVAQDIREAIEMRLDQNITIPILPSIIKYPVLLQGDSIMHRERYAWLRWEALHHLQKIGAVESFTRNREDLPLMSTAFIQLTPSKFDRFYDKLLESTAKRNIEARYGTDHGKPVTNVPANNSATETPVVSEKNGGYEVSYGDKMIRFAGNTLQKDIFGFLQTIQPDEEREISEAAEAIFGETYKTATGKEMKEYHDRIRRSIFSVREKYQKDLGINNYAVYNEDTKTIKRTM